MSEHEPTPARFGLGQPIRRKEDERLLTGKGGYTDDFDLPRQAWGAVVRSPHAHARIVSLDASAARAAPGVIEVLTAREVAADAVRPLRCAAPLKGADGEPLFAPPREVLQGERVRYVGDLVAFVVAETREQARDAAELVQVEYDALPAVVDARDADATDAPRLHGPHPSNCALEWQPRDNRQAVDAAFAGAARVARLDFVQNRICGVPMEPRAVLAAHDAASGRYTLRVPGQGVIRARDGFSRAMGVEADKVRALQGDTGGSFGLRAKTFPETVLCLWAAKRLGRPVKWRADRAETFVADPHARDHRTLAEMAFDADGRILGLRVRTQANMGAYLLDFGPIIPTSASARVAGTVYRVPAFQMNVRCMFTNTVPTDAYRGAGRPEMSYLVERLLDLGARELGIARDEIRRRNFIAPEELPWRNPVGMVIDSGRFAETMAMVQQQADWNGFAARRAESGRRGKRRGLGLACYLDIAGGGKEEQARVRFTREGRVQLIVGTNSHGQGHETAFTQIVAAQLGVPMDEIDFIQGDSDIVGFGGGTGGSRSAQMGGVATLRAVNQVVEKARRIAAHALEVASADLELNDGTFAVSGTDVRMTIADVAKLAFDEAKLPEGETPGLDETNRYERPTEGSFPNGAHVCEVEVDPDTGRIDIVKYVCVDDCGVPINPLIVEGQVHGGVVQGLGQALCESAAYDAESGQYLAATFMDYAMPRASDMPSMQLGFNVVVNPANELGVKGIGEGGTCVSSALLISAVSDALGVPHIDMPATPEKVWRALRRG
jgi:carbon-monoxide dehydrogenase large subunit